MTFGPPDASSLVLGGIGGIALIVAGFGIWLVRRHVPEQARGFEIRLALWLALWGAMAGAGVLARFDLRPPPVILMFLGTIGLGLWLGLSRFGGKLAERVPLWLLVGYQAFRLPLELVMHQAAVEKVMPVQMSYSGYNFDIVTGASALVLAIALARGIQAKWLVWVWNLWGCFCLVVIAIVAFAASPLLRAFGDESVNSWVAYLPFVYLPTVMVTAAIAGHVWVFRRLRA